MRYLANKTFQRNLKDSKLDDDYFNDVIADIYKGRALPLGAKMYKMRTAGKGQGKRGGFRNIFFWKKGVLIIFCLLFSKSEKENLDQDEKKVCFYGGPFKNLSRVDKATGQAPLQILRCSMRNLMQCCFKKFRYTL